MGAGDVFKARPRVPQLVDHGVAHRVHHHPRVVGPVCAGALGCAPHDLSVLQKKGRSLLLLLIEKIIIHILRPDIGVMDCWALFCSLSQSCVAYVRPRTLFAVEISGDKAKPEAKRLHGIMHLPGSSDTPEL